MAKAPATLERLFGRITRAGEKGAIKGTWHKGSEHCDIKPSRHQCRVEYTHSKGKRKMVVRASRQALMALSDSGGLPARVRSLRDLRGIPGIAAYSSGGRRRKSSGGKRRKSSGGKRKAAARKRKSSGGKKRKSKGRKSRGGSKARKGLRWTD
jgi:hypothetical protein